MRNPNLRLNDLVSRGKKGREESKLMNVKVPPMSWRASTASPGTWVRPRPRSSLRSS